MAGLGYWGPNLARNFAAIPGCELAWCCDAVRAGARPDGRTRFPGARVTDDLEDLLADPELDAIALATPVPTPRRARGRECSRPASTASSRSRWRSRSPTPSARSPRPQQRPRADGRPPARVPPRRAQAQGARRLRASSATDLLHLRQPAEPRQAARRRERAVEPRRPRRLGRAAPRRRGALEAVAHGESLRARRASRTSSSASCASRRASRRTCTCRGSTRTRSGGSRSSARSRMATFDDMALEGKVTIYDKGFDEDARGYGEYITRSGRHLLARGSPTSSRCGSSASTSSTASAAARRRAPTARAGCAWSACSSSCSARSTPRSGDSRWRLSLRPEYVARSPRRRDVDRSRRSSTPARDRRRRAIGAGAVIHDGTSDRRRLRDRGRRRARQAPPAAPRLERRRGGELGPLVLDAGVTVCAGAVVYAGARIDDRRDHRRPGPGARALGGRRRVGRRPRLVRRLRRRGRRAGADPDRRVRHRRLGRRGRRVPRPRRADDQRPHDGPPSARRARCAGPVFRRACRVGGGAVLVPGIEIGEEAFVAAGAVVTQRRRRARGRDGRPGAGGAARWRTRI